MSHLAPSPVQILFRMNELNEIMDIYFHYYYYYCLSSVLCNNRISIYLFIIMCWVPAGATLPLGQTSQKGTKL